jgi:PKD repeat protein
MSDFDKIIKDSIEGFEAPFDPQAWDKLSSQLSPLEDAVREAVEDFEAPYDANAWNGVKKQLDTTNTILKWSLGSAATLGLIFAVITYFPSDENRLKPIAALDNNIELIAEQPQTLSDNVADFAETEDIQFSPADNYQNFENTIAKDQLISDNLNESEPETEIDATTQTRKTDQISRQIVRNIDGKEDNTLAVINDDSQESFDPIVPTIVFNYNAVFSVDKSEICANSSIQFSPVNSYNDVLYVWSFDDGLHSAETFPNHTFENPGIYRVQLDLKDSKTNKTLASHTENIEVKALPNTDFTWEKSMDIIPTVKFINLTKEVNQISWKIDGTPVSDRNQFEHTFREKGAHLIVLNAESKNGCVTNKEHSITIEEDYNLLAPKAFSPNGDNINDDFIPVALKLINTDFTMSIYNQSARMVYQTKNVYEPWNGISTQDNAEAQVGAYVWVVVLRNANGLNETYTGQVILTR